MIWISNKMLNKLGLLIENIKDNNFKFLIR